MGWVRVEFKDLQVLQAAVQRECALVFGELGWEAVGTGPWASFTLPSSAEIADHLDIGWSFARWCARRNWCSFRGSCAGGRFQPAEWGTDRDQRVPSAGRADHRHGGHGRRLQMDQPAG